MAFEQLSGGATTQRNRLDPAGVYFAIYRDTTHATFNVAFRIMPDVMAKLGWKVSDRVEMLQGTGLDAGFLLIRKPRDAGGITYGLRQPGGKDGDLGGAFAMRAARLDKYIVPQEGRQSAKLEYQAFGGELKIMLPDYVVAKG